MFIYNLTHARYLRKIMEKKTKHKKMMTKKMHFSYIIFFYIHLAEIYYNLFNLYIYGI